MTLFIPATAEMPFPIHDYVELDSTNSEAKRLVAKGTRDAFVVSAKKQTQGRGRFNRVWHSPESNVAFTIHVPRLRDYRDLSTLSLMTGLAICRALEDVVGPRGRARDQVAQRCGNRRCKGVRNTDRGRRIQSLCWHWRQPGKRTVRNILSDSISATLYKHRPIRLDAEDCAVLASGIRTLEPLGI